MFDVIKSVVAEFLFSVPLAEISSTSYEYWLLVAITGVICIAIIYFPFAIVRWFFRGV